MLKFLRIKVKDSIIVVSGKTELGNPGEEPGKGYPDAGSMAKYYMGSYLIGSSPTKNLPTILPMPLKTHEEERSDSLLIIDFDLGDNLLDKHRYYLYENKVEVDFYSDDKILIESKFYSQLNEKQKKIFSEYPANKKIVIDSVEKIYVLYEL